MALGTVPIVLPGVRTGSTATGVLVVVPVPVFPVVLPEVVGVLAVLTVPAGSVVVVPVEVAGGVVRRLGSSRVVAVGSSMVVVEEIG